MLSLRLLKFPHLLKIYLLKITKLVHPPELVPNRNKFNTNFNFSRCEVWANKAWFAVRNNGSLRRRYFGTDSDKHIKSIQRSYDAIEDACDLTKDNIPFRCEHSTSDCTSERGKPLNAFVYGDENRVYICPGFFDYYTNDVNINARTLIHELSHLESIRGTSDYGNGYGLEKVKSLGKSESLMDADTFAYFASEAAGY
ncbi:hypothetical protein M9X92_012168 [Pyricularia oryzae]|nr:hypothetical protein M9X92_012168 [Pyricularia oryzae]